jgi:hypothetical protein
MTDSDYLGLILAVAIGCAAFVGACRRQPDVTLADVHREMARGWPAPGE